MAIEIAEGVVEIQADLDEADVRRTARRAAKAAADEADDEGKKRNGSFFKMLFTPNPRLAKGLVHSFVEALASPIGAAAGTLALLFVYGFVSALVGAAALGAIPVIFAALGAFLVLKLGKSFDDIFKSEMTLDEANLKVAKSAADLYKELREGKRTLDINTEAGQDNVEAILKQVQAYRDVYDANIANGMSIEKASEAYNKNIDVLRKQLLSLGYNKKAVDELLSKYKQVPTVVDVMTEKFNKLKSLLLDSANWLIPGLLAAADVGMTIFERDINPKLRSIFQGVSKYIAPLVVSIGELASRALAGIQKSIESGGFGVFLNLFTQHLPRLGDSIASFFTILAKYSDLIGEGFGVAVSVVDQLVKALAYLIVLGAGVLIVFGDMWHGMEAAGSAIASAWHGVTGALQGVFTAMSVLTAASTDTEKTAATAQLTESLKALWLAFSVFLSAVWDRIWARIQQFWASTVSPWLKSELSDLLDYLIVIAKAKLMALANEMAIGAQNAVKNFISYLASLPIQAAGAIAALPGVIQGVIIRAAIQAGVAAQQIAVFVLGAIAGLPARAYAAGAAIISNLVAGLGSQLGGLRNMASQIGATIANALPGSPVKVGPLKVLNHGYAGKQIVNMLADGISAQLSQMRMTSNTMANDVANGFGGTLTSGGNAGVSKVYNITQNITTQEISPVRQAAALGWEVTTVM